MPSELIRGWRLVRVKKTRQIKNLEPRFDSIETEKALELRASPRDPKYFQRGQMLNARTSLRRTILASIPIAATLGAAPVRADDNFPFGLEMTLDVARQ